MSNISSIWNEIWNLGMKSEIWVWNSGQLRHLSENLAQTKISNGSYTFHMLLPYSMDFHLLQFFSFLPFLCQHHGLCLNYYPPVGLWCVIIVTDIVTSILLRFSQFQTMVAINFTWTLIITIFIIFESLNH